MNSKEALERLYNLVCKFSPFLPFNLYEPIKQDLDRLEQLEKENEILKKAIENSNKAYDVLMQNSNIQFLNQNQEIAKLKKALKILRIKKVDISLLLIHKLEDYNFLVCNENQLTQEEYELLKEVLDCD